MEQRRPNLDSTFSTGDIARYCNVSTTQVIRWIKSKKLKAYRVSGGNYKIEKQEFYSFCKKNNIPIKQEVFNSKEKVRILVGEDDQEFMQLLKRAFELTCPEYDTLFVSDGYEALMRVGDYKPHLLILDLNLPKIDGLDVCRKIKGKNMGIIAMTGHTDRYTKDEVLDSGADQLFIKPFDFLEMLGCMRSLLDRDYAACLDNDLWNTNHN